MIGHLTNVKNINLSWKGSSNPHSIIFYIVTIVAIVPGLVISDIMGSLRSSLINSFNLYFEFTNGQEQKRQDKKMRLSVLVI
jgi:hypothetical protein